MPRKSRVDTAGALHHVMFRELNGKWNAVRHLDFYLTSCIYIIKISNTGVNLKSLQRYILKEEKKILPHVV